MPLLSLESTTVAHPGALIRRTKHLLSPSALYYSNSSRPKHKPRRKEGESGSKGWKRRRERWESEEKSQCCRIAGETEKSKGSRRDQQKGSESFAKDSSHTALANLTPIEFVCKIKFAEGNEANGASTEGGGTVMLDEGLRRQKGGMADLASFASSSSLHGLARVLGTSGRMGFRQTLWGLALLVSLGLFLYQATWSTATYLERPHLAAMREETRRELTFPAITLCNVNRFRFSALTDADIYHLANLTGLPPKSRKGHRPSELQYPPPDMLDIFQRTGHQLEDMLKSCNFSGQNCSSEDFSVVYTRFGKCYTFNGNKTSPKRVRQGGTGNGLELMLDIQQDEYLPIWRETNETTLEAGIRVQIHSQNEPPYIHQLGFGVSPGFQTFVSCQEQRLTYLPQPWGNCRASSIFFFAKPASLTNSGIKTFLLNFSLCRDNFLILDIFFEALNYETIEQKKAYDIAGLLGDIGGQMGLFIGASILTILEILDYIYEVVKYKIKQLLKPKKSQKQQNQRNLIQEQIQRTKNLREQNLRAQLADGTIATVRFEEVKVKAANEVAQPHSAHPTSILPNHHNAQAVVQQDFTC
ncbi:acid-sensing ion channel 4-like [Sinocyclocheilus grahami]|nr:PREDICTED: acid-sensing ion channel 4-like [Sinocyclocheilus grahami]